VIYKDGNVIAVNKPSGMATQGGTGVTDYIDKYLDYLKYDYDERPKLVHRLDKDTSGILLLARTRYVVYIDSLSYLIYPLEVQLLPYKVCFVREIKFKKYIGQWWMVDQNHLLVESRYHWRRLW
jgi:hypothetical protein